MIKHENGTREITNGDFKILLFVYYVAAIAAYIRNFFSGLKKLMADE